VEAALLFVPLAGEARMPELEAVDVSGTWTMTTELGRKSKDCVLVGSS
jgi:hypothetical protein